MKFSLIDIRTILAASSSYNLFFKLIAGSIRSWFVEQYIQPKDGDRILDIGCGTADILSYLPNVEYVGLDISQRYINSAKNRFSNRGIFLCKTFSTGIVDEFKTFDIILALGLLHHLDRNEFIQLFEFSRSSLTQGGRVITFDGCYVENQSNIARLLLKIDRGRYVRTKEEYLNLAYKYFNDIKVSIHHDLLRIPYTHIIMELK